MKPFVIACAAALLAVGAAQAQDRGARGILGVGVTTGGDTLASVVFTNGDTQDIQAGGLVHLYGGVELRVAPLLTMQATIGYQVDDTGSGSNGSLRFARYPLEVLVHYQINNNVRVGGGARFVNNARLTGSGVLSGINVDFESTTGAVVEGEYLVTPNIGLKLRAVRENYRPSSGGQSVDGSHVGFFVNWYL